MQQRKSREADESDIIEEGGRWQKDEVCHQKLLRSQ